LILNLGPPWPSRLGVSLAMALAQVLILMASYAVWRQGKIKVGSIKRWLIASILGFFAILLLAYMPLFSFFIKSPSDSQESVIVGWTYNATINDFVGRQAAKGIIWTPEQLLGEGRSETAIWTPESVCAMRVIIFAAWLFVWVSFATAVSAFLALQHRRVR
jgi:hypothetical protein